MSAPGMAASLPNPLTPLAFLSPEEAYQTTVTNYASVGALAVLTWDILDNAVADYRLLMSGLNLTMLVYITSRLGVLAYLLGSAIFSTAQIGHCALTDKIVNAFCPFSAVPTALLFFFRLRAVYNRNQKVVVAFFVMWLGLVVSAVFIPLGLVGRAIGPTAYCEEMLAKDNNTVAIVQTVPLVYDTLVFLAISWRLAHMAYVKPKGVRASFCTIALGMNLPIFSRSLLIDGQAYYLTTLVAGAVFAGLAFSPSVPGPLRSLATDPYIAVINIMACRVYRRTRTGLIRETEISTTTLAKSKSGNPIVFRHTRGEQETNDEGSLYLAAVPGSGPSGEAEKVLPV